MAARASISPARVAAFQVLQRVFEDDAYADRTFRSAAAELGERDRALAVRLVRGEIAGRPDPEIPGAWHVERPDESALAEGRIWPQSRGSQLAGLAVAARDGERTLDLCAAPGGKATMLEGEVVAVEVNAARARELEDAVRRVGATNVRVVHADGRALPPDI